MLEISCVRLNNQLKGNKYTSFTKVRVHGVHFAIFTTCSPLYIATIAADIHVELIIAAVVKHYFLDIIRLTNGILRNALDIYETCYFSYNEL